MILLEAKELTKRYGMTVALDSVAFQINDGIIGRLGPNGAGKSTVIKLSLSLLKPTVRSAEVTGIRVYESLEVRGRLVYMPEHHCLPRSVTAPEFLAHMAQVSELPPTEVRA